MISKRASAIRPSATLAANARVKALLASGVDVISFAGGEPDFAAPAHVLEAAVRAVKEHRTAYTPTSGLPELKKAICAALKKEKLVYEPKNILVTAGAKQAIYNLLMVLVNPGDEVVIPHPAWVSFPEMVKLAGGTISHTITKKTKLVIINTPSNPTGHVMSLEELKAVAKHNIPVISDETYDKLVYGKKHMSIASLIPQRTFVVRSFSKTYAIPGWRLGYCAGNADVIAAAAALQDHTTSNPNSIAQHAAIAALKKPPALARVLHEYKKRRDYMITRLRAMGINAPVPDGAFYIFANVGKDADAFAQELLEQAHVAVVSGTGFGDRESIRMSFTIPLGRIKEGMERFAQFLQK